MNVNIFANNFLFNFLICKLKKLYLRTKWLKKFYTLFIFLVPGYYSLNLEILKMMFFLETFLLMAFIGMNN